MSYKSHKCLPEPSADLRWKTRNNHLPVYHFAGRSQENPPTEKDQKGNGGRKRELIYHWTLWLVPKRMATIGYRVHQSPDVNAVYTLLVIYRITEIFTGTNKKIWEIIVFSSYLFVFLLWGLLKNGPLWYHLAS